jgi:hypothetical protein
MRARPPRQRKSLVDVNLNTLTGKGMWDSHACGPHALCSFRCVMHSFAYMQGRGGAWCCLAACCCWLQYCCGVVPAYTDSAVRWLCEGTWIRESKQLDQTSGMSGSHFACSSAP